LGKAYGLNTQVLLANLQHFCNNNIIILNYYYFIPGLFSSHSWWAESCSVRLSTGMVCSRQPQSFQGVHPHGRPDGWTEGGWWDGWRDARIQGRLHFSSRHPLLYVIQMYLTGTHKRTIHWMPVITRLWKNLDWVNIWFTLVTNSVRNSPHI